MKYSTTYPITASQMDGNYRLTVDGILSYHENTVARYLTSLGLAAFDMQKQDKTWIISEINVEMPGVPAIWTEDVTFTVWISEMSSLRGGSYRRCGCPRQQLLVSHLNVRTQTRGM